METNKYIPTSLVEEYLIKIGAELISEEKLPEIRPPFPCLTGAANTSNRFKIDKKLYNNIVAAGVDTLELNFGINEYRKPETFKQLDEAKLEALSAGYKGRKGVPVEWFGKEFAVQARGSKGGYVHLLKNGDVELQIMPEAGGGKPSPELRVIFRSPYLWRIGEVAAYNEVVSFLNDWAFIEYCRVSRGDLCVDMVMSLPDLDRKTQVISRVREKDKYYGGDYTWGQRDTGFQFGRGGIACRFYDKAYEISLKGHGHIIPIWMANGWDGVSPVSRLEPQFRRDGLKRFDDIMDFATFQNTKADMWAFVTQDYLRIIKPESASRKERAQVTGYWKDYQKCARLFGDRQGTLTYKQESLDWKPLVKQATGCMGGAWARLAADVGDEEATFILENAWGREIPNKVIEIGLQQKARFGHMS